MARKRVGLRIGQARWLLALVLCGGSVTAQAAHLEVVIETDGTTFKVASKKLQPTEAPQVYRQTFREGFYYIECEDATRKVVETISLPDPTKVFYDHLESPQQPGSVAQRVTTPQPLKGGTITSPHAEMILRLPADKQIKRLRIHRQKVAPKARRRALQAVPVGVTPGTPSRPPEDIELEPTASLELN